MCPNLRTSCNYSGFHWQLLQLHHSIRVGPVKQCELDEAFGVLGFCCTHRKWTLQFRFKSRRVQFGSYKRELKFNAFSLTTIFMWHVVICAWTTNQIWGLGPQRTSNLFYINFLGLASLVESYVTGIIKNSGWGVLLKASRNETNLVPHGIQCNPVTESGSYFTV